MMRPPSLYSISCASWSSVGALGLVGLLGRGVDQVAVLLVVPVRLVVGAALPAGTCRRRPAGCSCGCSRSPGRTGRRGSRRRRTAVFLVTLTSTPACLACSANRFAAGRRDRADVVAGEQLDLEALLAGLAEQRLGLVDVLLALRQVVGVGRVERGVQVVAERAVAAERLVDHLLAVDDQPHRLADPDVVERRLVDAHRERHPGAASRTTRTPPPAPLIVSIRL